MGDGQNAETIDLIRWTFMVDPEHRAEIEEHLADLGLDVLIHDVSPFVVTWDEPEGNLDEVIESIWALNGTPFEVAQEEFQRQSLVHLNHEDAQAEEAA